MKIAVLPFNTAESTKPAYGRQFAGFVADTVRNFAEGEQQNDINVVSYLTQVDEQSQRVAYVNISDGMLPYEQLKELFSQGDVKRLQDGFLEATEDGFKLTVRVHGPESDTPLSEDVIAFPKSDLFVTIQDLIRRMAALAEIAVPPPVAEGTMEFGTTNPDAFLNFLEGFDALNYINQANGGVAVEFSPHPAFDALLAAIDLDADFQGPYQVLVQLARACVAYEIGDAMQVAKTLETAIEKYPEEFPAYFALGELYEKLGDLDKSSNYYERAIQRQPNDAGLYARLGLIQMRLNMPVNAERNFKKSMELDPSPENQAPDMLAATLAQQGRDHEVPVLWKGIVDANPQNGVARAKYAMSLIQAKKEEEGHKAFESALAELEDNAVVKRFYAAVLAESEDRDDLDRAMDFYEDSLELAPNDIPTLMEYAQALRKADRVVDVPDVLKRVLASNPDQNTRAVALGELIELEQPKRAETVEKARAKLEAGDFEGAIRELKPLRNWLGDYYKMWYILAAAQNRSGQYAEAEQSTINLLNLFPGFEPAYAEFVGAMHGQQKFKEAYDIMQQAIQFNPNSLTVAINLAVAAQKAGDTDVARRLARQIREQIGPDTELESVLQELER